MGMLRNGCSISRSLSPVIRQEAFAEMANSRNLLSLGSRHSLILSDMSLKTKSSFKSFMIANRVSIETYLSNLERTSTSHNSLYVSEVAGILPNCLALSYASFVVECVNRKALIRVLVSITKNLFFIQQLLENFFTKSVLCSFLTGFFQQRFKIVFFHFLQNIFYLLGKAFLKMIFNFRRNISSFFCCCIRNFNNYSFHLYYELQFKFKPLNTCLKIISKPPGVTLLKTWCIQLLISLAYG